MASIFLRFSGRLTGASLARPWRGAALLLHRARPADAGVELGRVADLPALAAVVHVVRDVDTAGRAAVLAIEEARRRTGARPGDADRAVPHARRPALSAV